MRETEQGVFEDIVILSEEEDIIVNEYLDVNKFDADIDKRGSADHKKLIYDSIFFFQKNGFTLVPRDSKKGGDYALLKNGEHYVVECGAVGNNHYTPHIQNLIHVGYSRNILLFSKNCIPVAKFDCHHNHLHSKKNNEVISIAQNISNDLKDWDKATCWARHWVAKTTSVLPYFYDI